MQVVEKWTQQIVKPNPPNTNSVQDCVFTPDGHVLFAVVSDIMIAFNSETGDAMIRPIKAAKEIINCIAFAKDGRTLATGSNDKTCVIWKFNVMAEKKIEPVIKFNQAEAVFTLSFNPLTQQLFSGSGADFAIYTHDKTDIPKQKYKEKIICSSWSPDGQTLAFGTINGTISFRERNMNEKGEIIRKGAIWCMDWTPITSDHQQSYLLVGCWDNTFSLYQSDGTPKERISQKRISHNPTSVFFHYSGEYFAMTDTNKKLSIWSRDLNYLGDLMQISDWSWKTAFKPKSNAIALTTNDGIITVREMSKKPIFSSYRQIFATRDNLTDVVVENLLVNQKLRLKCKQLVKLIALYEDKLAVIQNERLLIYITSSPDNLEYKPYRKINKKFDCDFFALSHSHAIIAKGLKIQLFTLTGELEKQWILEFEITYLCMVGGPAKRQHILVGLKNGEVIKIFINNSFPINLYKASAAIVSCSLNLDKRRLAVIDSNNCLIIYDLITKTQLHQENGINSCVWNSDLEDTIAYTGMGQLSIKTGNMPALSQKSQAKVLGFTGFQLFVLKDDKITLMDVSQSSTLVRFIEKKDFQTAYKLASLGIADNDIRMLGIQALQNGQFDIAEKCFVKLKDLPFIELIRAYAEQKAEGNLNETFLKAEVLAYQGKYQEAADLYIKSNAPYQAAELYLDLKRFDDAKRVIQIRGNDTSEKKLHLSDIEAKQAEWFIQNNDPRQAIQLYIRSKNYKKAMNILTKMQNYDGLAELCRQMDKHQHSQYLTTCAQLFKKNKLYDYAKQAYLKLGDQKSLVDLYVLSQKWQDAFRLGKQNKQLLELIKLPYANFLMKNDEYEKALQAYQLLGRSDLTKNMLLSLATNACAQKRFLDSARHYYTLGKESMKLIRDLKGKSKEDEELYKKYVDFKTISEIYFAYNSIHNFVQSPFFTSSESALYTILNACRFIICHLGKMKLAHINLSYVYYSLAKVAKMLEGYKTARTCYERLMQLQVPKKWVEEVDLGSLLMRSKPYTDNETILPICNRCFMANPIINQKNICFNCKHPFIVSFASFEILPLVQFKVQEGLTHGKVMELLNSQKTNTPNTKKASTKQNDGWNEQKSDKQQVLSFRHGGKTQDVMNTPFYDKMNETIQQQQTSVEYVPIVLNSQILATLDVDSVYVQDLRKLNPTASVRYYKNLIPELLLKSCQECGKFFTLDQYQFEYIQHKHCPFCNKEDKRTGPAKSVFDI